MMNWTVGFCDNIIIKIDLKWFVLLEHRKLFSEKEMKEITKRNYKKLPEVQQKLTDDKYRRLRTADKFIVDTFAKV